MNILRAVIIAVALGTFAAAQAVAGDTTLPALHTQPGAQAVVDEHVDALNHCDWNRLMAQYPPEVQIYLPGGTVVQGRQKVGELFAGFCKSHEQGGLRGIQFTPEKVFTVGNTVNVEWRAEAPFLSEPYRGADAYVTKDGLMYAQVTTFDPKDMKLRQ